MVARSTLSHSDALAPLLLAIETAGSWCSAAIVRGAEVLAVERHPLRHGHAEALLPMVDRVAGAAHLSPSALEGIAVAIGPGGFTGIRAGMAAAHGIAVATGARLVGVSSFAAVAFGLAAEESRERSLLVALDSRRDDLYVQQFAPDGRAPLAEPAAILPDRLAAYVLDLIGAGPLLIAGDAAEAAAAALGSADVAVVAASAPDALGVAAAALRQLHLTATLETLRPLYLRPPDVTLPKGRTPGTRPR